MIILDALFYAMKSIGKPSNGNPNYLTIPDIRVSILFEEYDVYGSVEHNLFVSMVLSRVELDIYTDKTKSLYLVGQGSTLVTNSGEFREEALRGEMTDCCSWITQDEDVIMSVEF